MSASLVTGCSGLFMIGTSGQGKVTVCCIMIMLLFRARTLTLTLTPSSRNKVVVGELVSN